MSAVPWPTNSVTNLPLLLGRRDRDNSAYELVAKALDLTNRQVSMSVEVDVSRRIREEMTYGGPMSPFTTLLSEWQTPQA